MAQSGRDEAEMPMAIDGGKVGLAQSRHHPNAGQSAYASHASPASTANHTQIEEPADMVVRSRDKEIEECLARLMIPGKEEEGRRLMEEWYAVRRSRERADASPITLQDVKDAVRDALATTAATPASKPLSWASVAASGSVASAWVPKVVVPARSSREVVIQAKDQAVDLAGRTSEETVQAVNTALGGGEKAVTARRLRSGDTVLTFRNAADQYTKEEGWVRQAFGPTAQLSHCEFAVIAKAVPANRLKAALQDEEGLLRALKAKNTDAISKCRPLMPKDPHAALASMVVSVRSAEAARALCAQGLLWEARFFDCEPYSAEVKPKQCFRCYGYGHIARYCERRARCGHCAASAHEGGEKECPQYAEGVTVPTWLHKGHVP